MKLTLTNHVSPKQKNGEESFHDNVQRELEKARRRRVMQAETDHRLEEIRQASNVIQALENLVTQCDGLEVFSPLKNMAHRALNEARGHFHELVHGAAPGGFLPM